MIRDNMNIKILLELSDLSFLKDSFKIDYIS